MPLSEHEQRLLEQMEQQLLSDDPRFASTMRGPRRPGGGRRNLAVGACVAAGGLALLVSAVTLVPQDQRSWAIALGVLAFLVMLGGILFAVSGGGSPGEAVQGGQPGAPGQGGPTGVVRPDGRTGPRPAPRAGGKPRRAGGGTFMQRLEQRWDRRRDDRWS